MKKFSKVSLDEKETIINVNYDTVNIYTNRFATAKKLYRILGEPTDKVDDASNIYSMYWDIPISNRSKLNKLIALGVFLPPKKKADN